MLFLATTQVSLDELCKEEYKIFQSFQNEIVTICILENTKYKGSK